MVFSKEVGEEKPQKKIFEAAVHAAEPWLVKEKRWGKKAAPLIPSEVLHIGNDFDKDFLGACVVCKIEFLQYLIRGFTASRSCKTSDLIM